jgi:translation elongation factor EF-Tu-like GTPase
MTGSADAPLRMEVEQGFKITGRGTVIAARFLRGTIHDGDLLELVSHSKAGGITRVDVTCISYSLLCEMNRDPSKPPLIGVIVGSVIQPEEVTRGSILQAREMTDESVPC